MNNKKPEYRLDWYDFEKDKKELLLKYLEEDFSPTSNPLSNTGPQEA